MRLRGAWIAAVAALGVLISSGCKDSLEPSGSSGGETAADAGPVADAGEELDAGAAIDAGDAGEPDAEVKREPRCPADMVRVARRFCVDRFESTLIDKDSGQKVSPYYPPSRKLAVMVLRTWKEERLVVGDAEDQAVELPTLPGWEQARDFEPIAVAKKGVLPNGYMTGKHAELACKNAHKRLCSLEEWRTACRGEKDLPFPYGEKYEQGKCNIFREAHPAMELHNDASRGHSDPRLNLVKHKGKPLLRKTGETDTCASRWEDDAIYDMVGNLDEWIDDPEGTFVGGFFSRSKKDGCASIISAHPYDYFDYSTGARCCKDLDDGGGEPIPAP